MADFFPVKARYDGNGNPEALGEAEANDRIMVPQNGGILFPDGSVMTSAAIAAPGGIISRTVITPVEAVTTRNDGTVTTIGSGDAGYGTHVFDADATTYTIEVIGAGGGGGGTNSITTDIEAASSAGGGGGGYASAFRTITGPGTYTVGAHGVGGQGGNDGLPGGESTWDDTNLTLTCPGGEGGQFGARTNAHYTRRGGLGGVPTGNADLLITGGKGGDTQCINTDPRSMPLACGVGGSTRWGSGGGVGQGSRDLGGHPATGFGAGGGGVWSNNTGNPGYKGGDGAAGAILIVEYA